jgi:ElaB/YqjD/DUF883 family membrane-anchored ribosome-binding protein
MAQDPGEVRQAIEEDRMALADTVQALVQKADVKQRVRENLSRNADQLQGKAGDAMSRVRNVTPEQVQSGLRTTAGSMRQRPLLAAAVATFFFGLLIGRRSGRKAARKGAVQC